MALRTYPLPPTELQNVIRHPPDRGRKHGAKELKRQLAVLSAISAVMRKFAGVDRLDARRIQHDLRREAAAT